MRGFVIFVGLTAAYLLGYLSTRLKMKRDAEADPPEVLEPLWEDHENGCGNDSAEGEDQNVPLRFDGLYECRYEDYSSYLRFFADGLVAEVSSTGTPEEVCRWLDRNWERQGNYRVSSGRISFDVFSPVGQVSFSGVILNSDVLLLDSCSRINGNSQKNLEYRFRSCSFEDQAEEMTDVGIGTFPDGTSFDFDTEDFRFPSSRSTGGESDF